MHLAIPDRRTSLALLVAAVFFMENLDATVITTSMPAMALDFGVAPARISVGVSAYLIALTVFIPISGWASERLGPRRVFAMAIALFTFASVLCAISPGLSNFTAARTLQGIGGAMMVPVGRLIVLRDTPKDEIIRAIAVLTWPALVAPMLGPLLGGWISTNWSWHWIFLLNLPLGMVALAATWWLVDAGVRHRAPLDVPGFLLSGFGFGLFMGGVEAASRRDVAYGLSLGACAAGVGLLALTVVWLRRCVYPLFGLNPLGVATFRFAAVSGSIFRTAIGAAPFLLPLMFQVGFGWSAVRAGSLLLWLFAGNLVMKPATTWIMKRLGFRRVLILNGLAVAVGFALCAQLTGTTPLWLVSVLLFISGMSRSMQFTALNTIAFADITRPQMRDATTLFSVMQQMNAGMGIAVGALSLTFAEVLRGGGTHVGAAADFRLALELVAGLPLLALVDCWFLPNNAGHNVLGTR